MVGRCPRRGRGGRGVHVDQRAFPGVWRLGRGGRVLREPDRSVPPPGWYPSPYYPGVLQRWEGPGWAPLVQEWWQHEDQFFRRPAAPFL